VRDHCELKERGELVVGARTILGRHVTLHANERIELQTCVGLAERVTVMDSDHGFDGSDTFFMEQLVRSDPVLIEHNVFLATNVVVLRGTTIGRNAVAAAGAVLTGRRADGVAPLAWARTCAATAPSATSARPPSRQARTFGRRAVRRAS
jgi:acetyltransferase-like isoleucine patch superfamily enzyme